MPTVGFSTFFKKNVDTKFVVKNIASNRKRVKVFTYPIENGRTRDLLDIPFVSEADIRHSLLKGELLIKLQSGEITVVESNIDLLQFDDEQKSFLRSKGVNEGLEVSSGVLNFAFKQNISLIGDVNGINRTFTTPDKFIEGTFGNNTFSIQVRHNGRVMDPEEYTLLESGGSGTGYDTVFITSFIPQEESILLANYVVET